MTAPLKAEYVPVDDIAFAIAFFRPLALSANHIAAKRWGTGMPLPYRFITRVGGGRDEQADYPVLRIHTLAATWPDAKRAGNDTDNRAQVLVDYPGWSVTLPNGVVAHCEWAEITESAHEEPYAAETVATRFVSEMRLCLPFVPAL